MRATLLISLLLHAAVLAGAELAPFRAPPVPGEGAHIELLFGDPAILSARASRPARGEPFAGGEDPASVPRAAELLPARTGGEASTAAVSGTDTPPGVRLARPDPTVVQAREDPGNRPPSYPLDAWARGEQGTVILYLYIDERGRVRRVEKLSSSGFPSLDAAAMSAVEGWHFLPALSDGTPVASERREPVVFRLN
jgi:protein TonB